MLVYVVILEHKKENTLNNVTLKNVTFQSYYTDYSSKTSAVFVSNEKSDVCETQQHTCSWFIRIDSLTLSYAIMKHSTDRSDVPVDNEAKVDTALFP
jgi:hypothetical protein